VTPSALATPRLSGAVPTAPEERVLFRLAQLLILLDQMDTGPSRGAGLERLGFYDFFAANPFAVFTADDDHAARADLHAAGFDERQLSYASTGARFANRRQRLQHDVALLVAYGLVFPRTTGYSITADGRSVAAQFLSLYSAQYRTAASLVVRRLRKLSDTALAEQARQWLMTPSLLLDLYGSADPGANTSQGDDSVNIERSGGLL
jgi:hypothetical protein